MSKNLSKIWLRGLRRLVATSFQLPRVPKARAPASPVRAKAAAKTSKSAVKPKSALPKTPVRARAPRESRVRPRASAWAAGKWARSFHSSPPAAGRFINHLAYALYLPANAAAVGMPLVVMLHGCKQSAEEFAQGTRINLLADRFGFAVLYPEQSKTAHAHGRFSDSQAGGDFAVRYVFDQRQRCYQAKLRTQAAKSGGDVFPLFALLAGIFIRFRRQFAAKRCLAACFS